MTSFKDINFRKFPIKAGDLVSIDGGDISFSFKVKRVSGFILIPEQPLELYGNDPVNKIPIVDHGFVVTHVNGEPFNYSFGADSRKADVDTNASEDEDDSVSPCKC